MTDEPRRRPEDCIGEMLRAVYGEVHHRFRIHLGTKPGDYVDQPFHSPLSSIFSALENHRDFRDFVKVQYVDADFFIPNPGVVVECDESQHFTLPRKISLENYPDEKRTGYLKELWVARCAELDKHDNDPPFRNEPWKKCRDEQRAWYDTLRDFLPEIKGFQPTVRLYAEERDWCKMDPQNSDDVKEFKNILASKGSKIGFLEKINFPVTQTPTDPVLDEMIRFEYLTNIVKLQYLLDCTTGIFNCNSRYLAKLQKKTQVLNTGGSAFHAYFNHYISYNDRYGPLFSDRNPNNYETVAELSSVNKKLKNSISSSKNWFALFCEFAFIKTSLHELTADIHAEENVITNKYGYSDLLKIRKIEEKPVIGGGDIRDFVINCLNIGIDPSESHEGAEQEINHLAGCKYAEFQRRRKEWINLAWFLINRIKVKMDPRDLCTVMRWDAYAPCAYDTGPVFIRKNREFLLPRIAHSFETYNNWDQERLRENMYEIVGQYVTFVIENYWDHFKEKQTVDFLEGDSDLAGKITNNMDVLNSSYRKLGSHLELTEVPSVHCSGATGITFLQSKKVRKEIFKDTCIRDPGQKIGSAGELWTESGFLAQLQEKSGSKNKIEIAKNLIDWARNQDLNLGESIPAKWFIPYIGPEKKSQQLFSITTHGKMAIEFQYIYKYPQFSVKEKRQELVDRLNKIRGFNFSLQAWEEKKKQPVDMELLADPQNRDAFISMATWFFDELRKDNQQ